MPAECKKCNREYPAQELVCPFCETLNPNPKEVIIPRTLRWRDETSAANAVTEQSVGKETALLKLQNTIPQFEPYTTEGLRSAQTKVKYVNGKETQYKTSLNMHSEMVAVDAMLESGDFRLYLGFIVDKEGKALTAETFSTEVPHCGYCSIMLQCLGLPLTTATKGRHQYASHHNYPIPEKVMENPCVIARMLRNSYADFGAIKKAINPHVNVEPDAWVLRINDIYWNNYYMTGESGGLLVVDWADPNEKNKVLPFIWLAIRKAMYAVTI